MEKKAAPSAEQWLREAKAEANADKVGMFLLHNGIVRSTARALVRDGAEDTAPVTGMRFSYDSAKAEAAASETRALPGIYSVRVWLNEGLLCAGDDLMLVLIGGDTRPHTVDALQFLVGKLKSECVHEEEIY